MSVSVSNEQKFEKLIAKFSSHPSGLEEFMKNPGPALEQFGIEIPASIDQLDPSEMRGRIVSAPIVRTMTVAGDSAEQVSVEKHWWGVKIILNEKLTQDVSSGLDWLKLLAPLIVGALGFAGLLTGPAATVVGAGAALVIGSKQLEVKVVDNGQGVYFPLLWPQIAVLFALGPFPPMEAVAAAVSVHPVRN